MMATLPMDLRMVPTMFNQISYCHTTSDMPSGAVPFPFGDCKVCLDKATGVHYGVTTCEGCKGFFKRSITKGEKYKCFFGGQCILSPQNRNRCKSCRYKRCLDAGMSIEAVKMGRIPKVDKERALEEHRRKEEDKYRSVIGEDGFCNTNSGLDLTEHGSFGSSELVSSSLMSDSFGNDNIFSNNSSHRMGSNSDSHNHGNDSMKEFISQAMDSGSEGNVPQAMWKKFMMSLMNNGQHQNMQPPQNLRRGSVNRSLAMFNQVNQSMNPTSTTIDTPYNNPNPYTPMKRNPVPPYMTEELPPHKQKRALFPRNMEHKHDMQDIYLNEAFDMDISSTVPSYSDIHNDMFNASDIFDNCVSLNSQSSSSMKSSQNSEHLGHRLGVSPQTNSYLRSQNRLNSTSNNTEMVDGIGSGPHVDSTVTKQQMDFFEPGFHIKDEFDQYLFPDKPDILLNDDFLDTSSSSVLKIETNMKETDIQPETYNSDTSEPSSPVKDKEEHIFSLLPSVQPDGETNVTQIKCTVTLLSDAEKRHNMDTKRQIQQMEDELEGKENVHPWNKITVATKSQIKQVWDQLFASIPECNARILGFCRAVPGFRDVNPEDQEILMQYAYFDIWMITCAPLFKKGDTFMRFPNGARYSRWWMQKFLPEGLINDMHTFCNQLHECCPSDTEIAIVCAIRLTAPDRPGLSDSAKVKKLHSHLLDVLAYEVSNNHKTNAGRILIDLTRLLPMLSSLNEQQSRIIGNFKIDELPEDLVCKVEENSDEDIEQSIADLSDST